MLINELRKLTEKILKKGILNLSSWKRFYFQTFS